MLSSCVVGLGSITPALNMPVNALSLHCSTREAGPALTHVYVVHKGQVQPKQPPAVREVECKVGVLLQDTVAGLQTAT